MGVKRSSGATPGFGSQALLYAWGQNDHTAASPSTGAQPWKGSACIPYADTLIFGLYYYGTVVSGATYQAAVVTVSGTTISTITPSPSVDATATDTGVMFLPFATPVQLVRGTTYYLMVGRTDDTDTYALPANVENQQDPFPFGGVTSNSYIRTENAEPAVSDTVSFLTGYITCMGALWAFN